MRSIILTSLGITSAVLVLQYLGVLQLLECAILDQWFRLRPLEDGEPRIVIVTINEQDISQLQQWPVSDKTLARALQEIKKQKPEVIGLNLYRNLPIQPGYQDLLQVYASTPNLIGIKKVLSNTEDPIVKPPPLLEELNQVAASDLVLDNDGNIRRILLSVWKENKKKTTANNKRSHRKSTGLNSILKGKLKGAINSPSVNDFHNHQLKSLKLGKVEKKVKGKVVLTLGAKLALAYLAKENITLPANQNSTTLKLGKANFSQIQTNEGGYVGADIGGYQILANFHRLKQGFPRISLSDVLENRIPPKLMEGKVVIIGSEAESVSNKFYTPYTKNVKTAWTGTELHTNIASQIIAAALDGRVTLKGLPEVIECMWVFIWSSIGASLGWKVRDSVRWGFVHRQKFTSRDISEKATGDDGVFRINENNDAIASPVNNHLGGIYISRSISEKRHNKENRFQKSIRFWYQKSPIHIFFYIPLISFSLVGSAYLLFLIGYWITVAAPFLACISSIILIRTYSLWRSLQISHRQLANYAQNLKFKVQQRTRELQEKNIAIEKSKQEAEAANLAKSTFLANMSHELRTPLNVILGFTQVMEKDDNVTRAQAENIEIISRSGEHLLSLINDILEISKIEAGRIAINSHTFDLLSLLETLKKMFDLKAISKGINLIFDVPSNLPQYVQADESKLRQVLINLLENAIKFTQAGSISLRVEMKIDDSNLDSKYILSLEIQDTGVGIYPEDIARIFCAFEQTEIGKKSIEGTGLGLVISSQFVKLMGGDIKVSSKPNQGSIFSFAIPIKLSETLVNEHHKLHNSIISLASHQFEYKILVVDDHLESRKLLVKLLNSIGFQVKEAENGEEAIKIWSEWKPNLICMDIQMPVMNGYEATQKIKSHPQGRSIPILALSAYAFQEDKNIALSNGFDDFISKPFQLDVLLDKIRLHLNLTYTYIKDKKNNTNISPNNTLKLTEIELKNNLSQMPNTWLTKLHTASCICDDNLILKLLQKIPSENVLMIEALEDLTNNFRFDKIVELTQELVSE